MSGIRLVAAWVALASSFAAAAEPDPVAHWKLAGDAKDSSPNRLHADNRGVKFTAKGPDGKSAAAVFDGSGSQLKVKPSPALRFGTGDFTITLRVHTAETLDDDLGDLVTLYDAKKRTGFNLSLRHNTGVTSNQKTGRIC
jgi:opacity protein-like surface antigen